MVEPGCVRKTWQGAATAVPLRSKAVASRLSLLPLLLLSVLLLAALEQVAALAAADASGQHLLHIAAAWQSWLLLGRRQLLLLMRHFAFSVVLLPVIGQNLDKVYAVQL